MHILTGQESRIYFYVFETIQYLMTTLYLIVRTIRIPWDMQFSQMHSLNLNTHLHMKSTVYMIRAVCPWEKIHDSSSRWNAAGIFNVESGKEKIHPSAFFFSSMNPLDGKLVFLPAQCIGHRDEPLSLVGYPTPFWRLRMFLQLSEAPKTGAWISRIVWSCVRQVSSLSYLC